MPHLVFHVGHLERATGVEAVVLVVVLGASVVVPALLLPVALRVSDRERSPAAVPR